MMQMAEELSLPTFNVGEFIERLTWRTNAESSGFDSFAMLHETFSHTIKDLHILQERQHKKSERLEETLKAEQRTHFDNSLLDLQSKHSVAVNNFHQLDNKINSVAGKVIHLGEQLEQVNVPRSRSVEAQKLLNYVIEFLLPGPNVDDIFSQTSLEETADIIQKLYTISQDLPADKFSEIKKKINGKYDETERKLIDEFVRAQRAGDISTMRKLATILYPFKGYSQCKDAYIEESQMTPFVGKDIFEGIVPMCKYQYDIIQKVFTNPDDVMYKFILNIYHLKLNKYAQTKLDDRSNEDKYLALLYELYTRTMKLSKDLSAYNKSTDEFDILSTLSQKIFEPHLLTYLETELRVLDGKCSNELRKYYESKNHQKKKTERFQDFKRDVQANVQALIGTRANMTPNDEAVSSETLLSEELAINLLQEAKVAFKRCRSLTSENDLPGNTCRLAELLLQYLVREHVDYALNLGLNAIPISDFKSPPNSNFFNVVQKTNTIIHLLEKTYSASIIPCVVSTSYYSECLKQKIQILDVIELKLDAGIDRTLNAIMSWVKNYLQSEQKKNDFRPETDVDTMASPACLAVVQHLKPYIVQMQRCLDGDNISSTLTEFGCRLHKVIYDNAQQYQYNTAGAMIAICDVNEYRKLVRTMNSPLVTQLFDVLHALFNLLLVKQENIAEVCTGETLNNLDRSVVLNFIQLRQDYKIIKMSNAFSKIADLK